MPAALSCVGADEPCGTDDESVVETLVAGGLDTSGALGANSVLTARIYAVCRYGVNIYVSKWKDSRLNWESI